MTRMISIAVALAALGTWTPRVEPCCMVPKTYTGTISQSAQEALIFHHDGREDLILKINYKISGEKTPDYFAWIVTVPTEPDTYAVAGEKLFEEVFAWANPLVEVPTASADLSKALHQGSIELGKRVQVGPYDIQPVRARGKEALEGLNRWLEQNGFPTEDPGHMAYFVEQRFTFLCMKITPPSGGRRVAAESGVSPLQLSFKSEQPYYPLRFSSRQGIFDVNLYLFTQRNFDFDASHESLKKINWTGGSLMRNVSVETKAFPKLLAEAYSKGGFKEYSGPWRLNVLRTHEVNKSYPISSWKEDVFFRTKG